MTKKAEKLLPEVTDVQSLADANQQSMQTVLRSYTAWLQSTCQVQTEMLRFINKRIREDMEMPARFAQCKNPAEIVENQMSFATTMFQDYADESQKLLDLMAKATHDFAREAEAGLTTQLHD